MTEVYNLRYTHKCDLWSFGIILWEMCTRQYITLRPGTPESPRVFPLTRAHRPNAVCDRFSEELMHGMRPEIPPDCPALYAYLIR